MIEFIARTLGEKKTEAGAAGDAGAEKAQ
jgi:hypothetical protein